MADHGFTVTVSGVDPDGADFEQRFYDAGCTDVTVSVCQGRVLLDFDRWAPSLALAVGSAISNIERAGATVESVVIRRGQAETADTGGGQ